MQSLQGDRLGHDHVGERQRALRLVPRHHDDEHAALPRVKRDVAAVDVGQLEIDEHELGIEARELADRLRTAERGPTIVVEHA